MFRQTAILGTTLTLTLLTVPECTLQSLIQSHSTACFGSGSHIRDGTNTNTTLLQSALCSKGYCTQSVTAFHPLSSCTVTFQQCATKLVNPHSSNSQTSAPRIITLSSDRPTNNITWRSAVTTQRNVCSLLQCRRLVLCCWPTFNM